VKRDVDPDHIARLLDEAEAQGVGRHVTDPAVLRVVAVLLKGARDDQAA
jgi:hypothetical protein